MRNKMVRSVLFALLALLGSAVTFVLFQVCFVQSFWVHAAVFPINPQTVSQPTGLTYLGIGCQIIFAVLLLLGAGFILQAAWLFLRGRRCDAA
jgi:hypothetical protein